MKEEELIFHLIYFGLISKNIESDSVNNWIEKKFNENNNSQEYLDLVSTNNIREILNIIHSKINLNFKETEIRNLILSFYNEYIKRYPENIEYIEKDLIIYYELVSYEDSNEKTDDFLSEINDDYNLRKDGFSGSKNLKNYLLEKLEKYDEYSRLLNILKKNSLIGYEI